MGREHSVKAPFAKQCQEHVFFESENCLILVVTLLAPYLPQIFLLKINDFGEITPSLFYLSSVECEVEVRVYILRGERGGENHRWCIPLLEFAPS